MLLYAAIFLSAPGGILLLLLLDLRHWHLLKLGFEGAAFFGPMALILGTILTTAAAITAAFAARNRADRPVGTALVIYNLLLVLAFLFLALDT